MPTTLQALEKLFIKIWWDSINLHGPFIGYFPEPSKSWLIVKEEHYDEAITAFEGSKVKITKEGNRHLGDIVGSLAFKKEIFRKQGI